MEYGWMRKKPMIVMLICVGILFGGVFFYKFVMGFLSKRYMANLSQVVTVATTVIDYDSWQPSIKAAATLRAIRGVNVTTELAGMVKTIYFEPGAIVTQGTVLVQLNADSDIAQLHALQANAELARITYNRDKAQYAAQAVSKATVDTDFANLKSLTAQVEQQQANVNKKTLRAPFSGKLGVSMVNPGQYINPGDKVVNLQTFNPIWADFYVPQQSVPRLKVGQKVNLTSDSFPNQVFTGKITTMDPAVDTATRNLLVEATLDNPKDELSPGMFAIAEVIVGQTEQYLTLPASAVSFNPYGEVVYIVHEKGKDKEGKPRLIANQAFVTTGQTRGDQVSILHGLQKGQVVVISGQLKLKNGMQVAINNSVVPSNSPSTALPNEH